MVPKVARTYPFPQIIPRDFNVKCLIETSIGYGEICLCTPMCYSRTWYPIFCLHLMPALSRLKSWACSIINAVILNPNSSS